MTVLRVSPLRYPGGKGKIAQFVAATLINSGLLGCEYVEPFVGGGAVGLFLLINGYVDKITINDIDPAINTFWWHVVHNNDELCNLIDSTNIDIEQWHVQREIQKNKERYNGSLELALSTLFLNRTNRSGIIWAGPIGGQDQKGKWKIDCRFNKKDLINRLKLINKFSDRIRVFGLDARDFILNNIKNDRVENKIFYLDPPYFVKGQGLYLNAYSYDDHKKLADIVKMINCSWMVSYDNVEGVLDLYNGCDFISYGINYCTQNKYKGSEVIFRSKDIVFPSCDNPTTYKINDVSFDESINNR